MPRTSPLFTWRSAIADKASHLTPKSRLVALTLSLHMSERGDSAAPSLQTQAEETGLNKRQVSVAHKELEKDGWLNIKRGTQGRGNVSRYTATIPPGFVPHAEWKERVHGETFKRNEKGPEAAPLVDDRKGSAPAPISTQEKVPLGSVKGADVGTRGRKALEDVTPPSPLKGGRRANGTSPRQLAKQQRVEEGRKAKIRHEALQRAYPSLGTCEHGHELQACRWIQCTSRLDAALAPYIAAIELEQRSVPA